MDLLSVSLDQYDRCVTLYLLNWTLPAKYRQWVDPCMPSAQSKVCKFRKASDFHFQAVFNSWVRSSVPRVIAGTRICKWVTRSLVVDVFVINRVRTREREDLSFPKKHALAEVRWHQIPRRERASCATARSEDRGLTKFKTRRNLSHWYDSRAFDSSRR